MQSMEAPGDASVSQSRANDHVAVAGNQIASIRIAGNFHNRKKDGNRASSVPFPPVDRAHDRRIEGLPAIQAAMRHPLPWKPELNL